MRAFGQIWAKNLEPNNLLHFFYKDKNALSSKEKKYRKLLLPNLLLLLLIHSANPQSRPAGSDHCFLTYCPSVRTSTLFKIQQNKRYFKRKQHSLLARLWVWPSGSSAITSIMHPFVEVLAKLWSMPHSKKKH